MTDVLDHFPHPFYKYGQKHLIEGIWDLHQNPDIKYIIVQSPTGTGKTAAAGTPAVASGNAYYLSNQKIHQQQVKDEFPDAVVQCKGQLNYHCGEARVPPCKDAIPIPETRCELKPSTSNKGEFAGTSAKRGDLKWQRGLDEKDRCPYMDAKTRAMESNIACLNYAYFFNETYYAGDFGRRDIMICDEAHNIEDNLASFITFRIDDFVREELSLDLTDRGPSISDWKRWIVGPLHRAVENRLSEVEERVERMWNAGNDIPQSLLMRKDTLDEIGCNIRRFDAEHFDGCEWAVEREFEDNELKFVKFAPVTVAPFAERFLFDYADTVVLMSATILGAPEFKTFRRGIGLANKDDEIAFFNIPSPFNPKDRPVYWYDSPSINHDNWKSSFPKVCRLIDEICHQYPDNGGLIHSISYRNGKAILEEVSQETRNRIIHHNGDLGREEALDTFKSSTENPILMSPGMMEGIDLPYDESRFQIIAKLPFASLASQRTKKRKDLDPSWYSWQTSVNLIQAMGRSMRYKDDWCDTHILDGNFSWFYDQYDYLFPDYLTGSDEIEGSIIKDNISKLL